MKARDIMRTKVVTVRPDAPVRAVARLLLERGLSAVPVIDEAGQVLGVVSEGDLVRRAELGTERRSKWWLSLFSDPTAMAEDYAKARGLTAGDVMATPAVTTDPDAELTDVVARMEENRVKRLPVVDENGRLVGIVSRADLLRAFVATPPGTRAEEGDRDIRRLLIAKLRDEPWATIADGDIVVADGVVHFWGTVASDAERRALRVAAESIPGVREVRDHTVLYAVLPAGL